MKFLHITIFLLFFTFFLSSCSEFDPSTLSDEDINRISRHAVVCDEPYIRHGTGCCLDTTGTGICDKDETDSASEKDYKTDEDKNIAELDKELSSTEKEEDQNMRSCENRGGVCAQNHEDKIEASEIPMIGAFCFDSEGKEKENERCWVPSRVQEKETYELDKIAETELDQMVNQIDQGSKRLTLRTTNININRADATDNYYSLINQFENTNAFEIFFGCDRAQGSGSVSHITFDYIKSTSPIKTNGVDVQRVRVNADPQASTTSYRCVVFVAPKDNSADLVSAREKYTDADDSEKKNIIRGLTDNPKIYDFAYFFVNVETHNEYEKDDENKIGELEEVQGTVQEQMIDQIRSSNERLSFRTTNINVDRASNTDNYYAVMNQLEGTTAFETFFGCDRAQGSGSVSHITFDYIDITIPIQTNRVDVQRVRVNADPQAKATSYRCVVFVADKNNADELRAARNSYANLDDAGKTEIVRGLTSDGQVYDYAYFFVNVE